MPPGEDRLGGGETVIFAALAFLNLIMYRVASGRRPPSLHGWSAGLGVVSVSVLSAGEVMGTRSRRPRRRGRQPP